MEAKRCYYLCTGPTNCCQVSVTVGQEGQGGVLGGPTQVPETPLDDRAFFPTSLCGVLVFGCAFPTDSSRRLSHSKL